MPSSANRPFASARATGNTNAGSTPGCVTRTSANGTGAPSGSTTRPRSAKPRGTRSSAVARAPAATTTLVGLVSAVHTFQRPGASGPKVTVPSASVTSTGPPAALSWHITATPDAGAPSSSHRTPTASDAAAAAGGCGAV